MPETLTDLPFLYEETFDITLTPAEQIELVNDLKAEGASGDDPVETIRGVIRYLRKKWDERNE